MESTINLPVIENVTIVKTKFGYMIKKSGEITHSSENVDLILSNAKELLEPSVSEEKYQEDRPAGGSKIYRFTKDQTLAIIEMFVRQGLGLDEILKEELFKDCPTQSLRSKLCHIKKIKPWPHEEISNEEYVQEYTDRGSKSKQEGPSGKKPLPRPDEGAPPERWVSYLNQHSCMKGGRLFINPIKNTMELHWYATCYENVDFGHFLGIRMVAAENPIGFAFDKKEPDLQTWKTLNDINGRDMNIVELPISRMLEIVKEAEVKHE